VAVGLGEVVDGNVHPEKYGGPRHDVPEVDPFGEVGEERTGEGFAAVLQPALVSVDGGRLGVAVDGGDKISFVSDSLWMGCGAWEKER
jgi:hypothetical protein